MKILLTLTMATMSLGLHAAELDSISLITPTSYDRPSSFGQTLISKSKTGIGKLINYDVLNEVLKSLEPNRDALKKYYKEPGELDSFVTKIVNEGKRKHLTSFTDDNLVAFHKYIGQNLIGKIADKVLTVEGVEDSSRRAIWVNKILAPHDSCISKSLNANFDADHCTTALTDSLVPSMGIGIVYELSKSKLISSLPETQRLPLLSNQVELYKSCLAKTKATTDDVENCALSAMKTGVFKVTDYSLTKTINEKISSKSTASSIKETVWPPFQVCINNIKSNPKIKTKLADFFLNCIDDLISNTGSLIVQDKIATTPAIAEILSAPDIKLLANEKSLQFKKCAAIQKAKGAQVDGMLDISPCENTITNEITYKVVSETFRETARTSLKSDKAQATKVGNAGVDLLNKCWSNQQTPAAREACLKKSIVSYSQNVATLKLDGAIPQTMPGRDQLNKSSVAELSKCLDKELPTNISESNDLTKRLDGCTGKLTRNVALKVADYQIRDTAKGNLSDIETNKLVNTMVNDEFAKCIGNSPSDEALDRCGNALTIKAAKFITDISFAKEVNGYLKEAGGLKALGLTQETVDSFLVNLNKSNSECIDKKSSDVVMDQVNRCIKDSVKKIAFFFGDVKFNQSIGDMYKGRDADKEVVEVQFKKSLSDCLDTKSGKEFSITDYTKNLYTCSDKVSTSTTLVVGQDQVNSSLDEYLKDRPNMDLKEKREALRKELLGNFKSCMSREKNQNVCIDTLKKEATKSIVVNYGKIETKAQLNADKTPAQLRPVEDNFIACTDSKLEGDALAKHLDECTKNFALNFAKELGALKLTYLLKQTLGSDDYNTQLPAIERSIAKYNACLDNLKQYQMSEGLTDKLSTCTDALTSQGMNIVRSNINTWMSSDQKDAATVMLKQEFAHFLPCISALIPASPYTQQLQSNIDSSVKPLTLLLSHYIEYNPENAKQTLQGIISKLSIDLNDVAKTNKAKSELLDFLYKSGGLDQFLKAIVRGTVKDALVGVSEQDVPADLRAVLLKKETFEEIFNTPEGTRIKDAVMDKILKPTLIDNVDLKGPAYKVNMEVIKDDVTKLLVNAPSFGEMAIKMSVQSQIDSMGGVTKFFAKAIYGGDSLNWEKVRTTEHGKQAEEYIKENVLLPKFKGVPQTPEEQKKIMDEATKMVTKAVKSYG